LNETTVVSIAVEAMAVTAKLAGPILLVSLAVGLFVSLIQAATQVQEATLTFVPKLVAIALVIVVGGTWMLHELVSFTRQLFDQIPNLVAA